MAGRNVSLALTVVLLLHIAVAVVHGADHERTHNHAQSLNPTPVTTTTASATHNATNATKASVNTSTTTTNTTTTATATTPASTPTVISTNSTKSTNATGTSTPPPANPTLAARGGVKEFVSALYSRIKWDEDESQNAYRAAVKLYQTQAGKLEGLIFEAKKSLKEYDDELHNANQQIKIIGDSIAEIKQQQQPLWARLNKTLVVFDTTKHNWKLQIDSLTRQRDTALSAAQDVDDVISKFRTSHPPHSVRAQLAKHKATYSGSGRVSDVMEEALRNMAVEDQNKIADSTDSKTRFSNSLHLLKTQLTKHAESLWEDLITTNRSMTEHIRSMRPIIEGVFSEIKALDEKIKIELRPLDDFHRYIDEILTERGPRAEVHDALVLQYSHLNVSMTAETDIYKRQEINRKKRLDTLEMVHQVIKRRLIDGNDAAKTMLNGIKNKLSAKNEYRYEFASQLDIQGTNAVPALNPMDFLNELCGSYKFGEAAEDSFTVDGSPYGNDGKLHGISIHRGLGHDGKGKSMVFDGMNDFIDLGRANPFGSNLNNFTISMWVRTAATTPALSSILKSIDEGIGQVLAVEPNRRVGRQHPDGVWPTGQQALTDISFESGATLVYLRDRRGLVLAGHVYAPYFDNKWHHLQWSVLDASRNQMHFFMDGREYPFVASIEQGPHFFTNFGTNLYLGAGNNRGRPEGYFDGALSEVQFFCQAVKAPPVPTCCAFCKKNEKVCGDLCVPKETKCLRSPGCACEFHAGQAIGFRNTTSPSL